MSQDDYANLQRTIQDKGHTWRAGPTSMTVLPPEEQDRRLGLRLEPREMERLASLLDAPAPRDVEFPAAWDWRDVEGVDWTTTIRDQRGCGSCVAFATLAVMEAMLKRHHNDATLQPDLSEAHLFFCGCGDCCGKGWWPSYALNYAKSSGVPDEDCFPYQDFNLPCSESCSDWHGRAVKVSSWAELLDAGARKQWLATKGPVIGCLAVYRDFYSYTDGVYRHSTGDLAGYHAICVVGYSEAEQAWICKNSWGIDWGNEGWFKIGYGECGIDSEFAMYGVGEIIPPGVDPEPEPEPDPEPDPNGGCNLAARLAGFMRGEDL